MFVYAEFGKTAAKLLEIGIGLVRKVTLFCPFFLGHGCQGAAGLKLFPLNTCSEATGKLPTTISTPLIHYKICDSALVIILNLIKVLQLLSFT